jgi:hypothetical protein
MSSSPYIYIVMVDGKLFKGFTKKYRAKEWLDSYHILWRDQPRIKLFRTDINGYFVSISDFE